MPVTDTIIEESFDGNGSTTTPYPISIPRSLDEDLKLLVDGVISTDFTVSPDGFRTGVAYAGTVVLTLYRATPLTQNQSFPSNTTPAAEDVRAGLDKVTLIAQEIKNATNRSLKAGPGEIPPGGTVTKLANTFMGQDSSGNMVSRTVEEARTLFDLNPPTTILMVRPNKVWADAGERALAVPDYIGQDGKQIDEPNKSYTSTGGTAGDWVANVGVVRYDESQSLTVGEQLAARDNIDAPSNAALTSVGNEVTSIVSGVKTFTSVKTFASSPIVPTPPIANNSTQVATTAFVQAEFASKTPTINDAFSKVLSSSVSGTTTGVVQEVMHTCVLPADSIGNPGENLRILLHGESGSSGNKQYFLKINGTTVWSSTIGTWVTVAWRLDVNIQNDGTNATWDLMHLMDGAANLNQGATPVGPDVAMTITLECTSSVVGKITWQAGKSVWTKGS